MSPHGGPSLWSEVTEPLSLLAGTRPLHEALIGGSTQAVCNLLSHGSDPLLYDYTGHMPSDLAEEDDDMRYKTLFTFYLFVYF